MLACPACLGNHMKVDVLFLVMNARQIEILICMLLFVPKMEVNLR